MTRTGSICIAMLAGVAAFASAPLASANEETIPFDLTPGKCKPFTVPVSNQPVLVMGTQPRAHGVGQVTLVRATAGGGSLTWVGMDRVHGALSGSVSFSSARGVIAFLDTQAFAYLANGANGQLTVCNDGNPASPQTAIGSVTLVY